MAGLSRRFFVVAFQFAWIFFCIIVLAVLCAAIKIHIEFYSVEERV